MFCTAVNAFAQNMREVFKQMPDSLLPQLTQNNRLDLIDFIDSNMKADVTNKFDEHTKLNKLTDRYIELEVSKALTMELFLVKSSKPLPDSSTYVVAMVNTYNSPRGESTLKLYTEKWKFLENIPLRLPQIILSDTLPVKRQEELRAMAATGFAVAILSTANESIELDPFFPYLTKDEVEEIKYSFPRSIYIWDGETFKKD